MLKLLYHLAKEAGILLGEMCSLVVIYSLLDQKHLIIFPLEVLRPCFHHWFERISCLGFCVELRYIFELLLKLTNIKLLRCEEISAFLSLEKVVFIKFLRLLGPILNELRM